MQVATLQSRPYYARISFKVFARPHFYASARADLAGVLAAVPFSLFLSSRPFPFYLNFTATKSEWSCTQCRARELRTETLEQHALVLSTHLHSRCTPILSWPDVAPMDERAKQTGRGYISARARARPVTGCHRNPTLPLLRETASAFWHARGRRHHDAKPTLSLIPHQRRPPALDSCSATTRRCHQRAARAVTVATMKGSLGDRLGTVSHAQRKSALLRFVHSTAAGSLGWPTQRTNQNKRFQRFSSGETLGKGTCGEGGE